MHLWTWRTRTRAHLGSPLYRSAYALILGTVVAAALGIVYWVLAARLYSAEAVGVNSALLSAMMLISGVSQLNLRSALNRFVPVAGSGTARLVAVAYLATVPLAILFSLGLFLVLALLAPGTPLASAASLPLILWFIVATGAWNVFNAQDGVLTGLRQAYLVPVENTIYAVAKIVLLLAFASTMGDFGIFLSWTLPTLAGIVIVNLAVFRVLIPRHIAATRQRARRLRLAQLGRFVAGDYLGALLVLVYVSLLPFLVISLAGPVAGAHFYIAWIIASSLNLVPVSLAISHTVEAVSDEGKLVAQTREVLIHTFRLLIPVSVLIVVGAPNVLALFGPDYAVAASDTLRALGLAVLPYSINVLYFSFARVETRMKGIVIAQGMLAALTLTLTLLLLPPYGITGVGVAWLVSHTTVAVVILATGLRPIWRSRPDGASALESAPKT